MKISIVIPVFNDIRVSRALESLLSQQHGHELEIVVVDAGSTDGTVAALEHYRNRVYTIISEPDRGIYDGMNKGIRQATGEIIGILNADDQYSDPFVIRDVTAAFEMNASADACYGDLIYTNPDGKVVRYWKAGDGSKIKWHLGWMPPHTTFFVRRRVYESYGGFDLRYPIAADYELMLRLMLKHRIGVKYLSRIITNMAPGGVSNRSPADVVRANIDAMRAWKNNGLRWGLLVPFLKPARKIAQYASRPSVEEFPGSVLLGDEELR